MGGGTATRGGVQQYDPLNVDPGMVNNRDTDSSSDHAMLLSPLYVGPTRGDKKVYDKNELAAVVDALNRIGAGELALPPEFLGKKHMPVNHVLPMLPTNTMPEDILFSL